MDIASIDLLPEAAKRVLARHGYTVLFPPQVEAVERGVLSGRSIVMATPTGSGKSLVALLAALKTLMIGGRRVVYMAPLRSIVYERASEWSSILRELGFRVAVATGDYDRVEPWLASADVVLATYEKLDSLLRHGEAWLYEEVGLVVVDEVHYISDPKRGPVLETVIARLSSRGERKQFVALSATMPNASEVAKWLDASLIYSDWRPVRLREGVYHAGVIEWADGGVRRVRKLTGIASLDVALDSVEEGGQALVFVQSRRKAVSLALRLLQHGGLLESRELPENVREALRSEREHETINNLLARLLTKGIGFHHAGLASYQRSIVERLFRQRFLNIVFATPTLAAGVNLPARRVIVDSLHRYQGGFSEAISVSEYKQLAGRAGRPGFDAVGEAVIIARSQASALDAFNKYIRGSPEPIRSRLSSEKALRSQILAIIAAEKRLSVDGLLEVFSHTFYASSLGLPLQGLRNTILSLKDIGLIELRDNVIEATQLGKRVAELYIDPLTAKRMLKGLRKLASEGRQQTEYAIFLALWNPDSTLLHPPRNKTLVYEAEAELMLEELGLENEVEEQLYDLAIAAKALYTSELILDWINEEPEKTILDKYGIGPGDLYSIVNTTEWLTYSLAELSRITAPKLAESLRKLHARVAHGVREELIELTQIENIGRVRARILYRAGIKTAKHVASLKPEELARLLPGLGLERAKQAIASAAQLAGEKPPA